MRRRFTRRAAPFSFLAAVYMSSISRHAEYRCGLFRHAALRAAFFA